MPGQSGAGRAIDSTGRGGEMAVDGASCEEKRWKGCVVAKARCCVGRTLAGCVCVANSGLAAASYTRVFLTIGTGCLLSGHCILAPLSFTQTSFRNVMSAIEYYSPNIKQQPSS